MGKETVKIKIKMLNENGEKLKFVEGNSGSDIRSVVATIIKPGERKLIDCGFKMEIPEGYEAQIRPRSGLAIKNGITVLNAPGTIDQSYRGIVKVILINLGEEVFYINPGDRIAQMIIAKVETPNFVFVDNLSETEREEGGFGSTGIQ
jgi:dUTP pyrophosphatase